MTQPSPAAWQPPPAHLTVQPDAVHVWRASLALDQDRLARVARTLTGDERARGERLRFERDRRRFVAGRGLLRAILGRYLRVGPGQVRFVYGPHGKPALADPHAGSEVSFNLAHSEDLALYAVAHRRPVGIDVEAIRSLDEVDSIVERFFSPGERAAFRAVPKHARDETFFTWWTRKEAYVKARGRGLADPLDGVDISLLPGEPAAPVRVLQEDALEWWLQDLHPAPGYAAALAVAGGGWHLTRWQWPHDADVV